MKLLIVDDHPVFREGFAALIGQTWREAVVLHAHDAAAALAVAEAEPEVDLLVLDLALPGADGFAAMASLGQRWPAVPVLVLSASEDQAQIRAAIARGASGYVPKSAGSATLISAIRLVLAGEIYVPPAILAPQRNAESPLTPRQVEVLRLVAAGSSNKEIARALGMAEKTVKAHLATTFRTLGASNRTHAIAAARKQALLF